MPIKLYSSLKNPILAKYEQNSPSTICFSCRNSIKQTFESVGDDDDIKKIEYCKLYHNKKALAPLHTRSYEFVLEFGIKEKVAAEHKHVQNMSESRNARVFDRSSLARSFRSDS